MLTDIIFFVSGFICIIYLISIVIDLNSKNRILESRVEDLEDTIDLLINKISKYLF